MGYPDSLLRKVVKPARYTGGEWNSVVKDWNTAEVRIVLSYPDVYEVGMSNLALPTLYELLNKEEKILAERVFTPWVDMQAGMRQAGIPLISLESKHSLREFDIFGFSLGYELTYTNVLSMLDLAGIPLFSSERSETYPLVIAGGSCALNPEPMADFIDAFVLGDGEDVLLELVSLLRYWKKESRQKEDLLRQLATIPGVYVPCLYHVDYHLDGTVSGISPLVPEAKPKVTRRIITELPLPPVKPVVPYVETIHDRGVVEIQRGCIRGCRFCQAGVIYRPQRQRSPEVVVEAAEQLLQNCGYSKISLLSLNASGYPGIEHMIDTLNKERDIYPRSISLPSLRIDNFSIELMNSLSTSGKKPALTFAPEVGTERMKRVINKNIPEDTLLTTISTVLSKGWSGFKLYFMIGLPTETQEDIESIPTLIEKIYQQRRKPPPRIRVNLSAFVPKAHTPFQWVAQEKEEQLREKQEWLKQRLRRIGVRSSWQRTEMSFLETVLSRGDRRLGKVIYYAWQRGCGFDSWTECFNYAGWLEAFEQAGIDPTFYAHRQRPLNEILPWSHIDTGVSLEFLKREYCNAMEERETPDCSNGVCNACGLEQQCQKLLAGSFPNVV